MKQMPTQTAVAIKWALQQEYTDCGGCIHPVSANNPQSVTDKVCEYFTNNQVDYAEFDYYDLTVYVK